MSGVLPFAGAHPGPLVDERPTWGAYLRDVPGDGYEVFRPQPPLAEDLWTPSAKTEWAPNSWCLVRRTQPATERVPWHEAVGRRLVSGGRICQVTKNHDHISIGIKRDEDGSAAYDRVDEDGTVEVLVENEVSR